MRFGYEGDVYTYITCLVKFQVHARGFLTIELENSHLSATELIMPFLDILFI